MVIRSLAFLWFSNKAIKCCYLFLCLFQSFLYAKSCLVFSMRDIKCFWYFFSYSYPIIKKIMFGSSFSLLYFIYGSQQTSILNFFCVNMIELIIFFYVDWKRLHEFKILTFKEVRCSVWILEEKNAQCGLPSFSFLKKN